MHLILSILALLALSPPLAAESFDGRSYQLFDGSRGTGRAPLVLVLHGAGGTGPQLRASSGFDAHAARAGVIAVYPSAPRRLWNDGRWAALGRDDIAARDDTGWLLALVDHLVARGRADPGQVHVIGHSNGGGMAMALGCAAPQRLAGIAVVATKVLDGVPCTLPDPLPAVFFYGTQDRVAPHAGRGSDDRGGATLSARESVALWQARNRCRRLEASALDPVPGDGITLRRLDGQGCRAPLRVWEMRGAGHAWPGAEPPRQRWLRRLIGPPIRDIDAGAEALTFWLRR